jgi:predicted nucleotidyltransferase
MRRTLSQCADILRAELGRLDHDYGVHTLHIFGSIVRGTNTDKSDVDILVSFHEIPSLFILARLEMDLRRLLSCPVDLVLDSELAQPARDRILQEMVRI